jgi:Tol biopolymer transport system component
MRWLALLTLTALLASGCAGSKEQETEPSGRIAFVRGFAFKPGSQLWLMNADGSGQRRLTRGRGSNSSPAWSPDGRRVAYAYDAGEVIRNAGTPQEYTAYPSHILVVTADGRRTSRLTKWQKYAYEQKSSPEWSPDGRTVAFHVYDDGAYWISRVGSDGSRQRNLTRSRSWEDGELAWSPDGRKIAFTNVHEVGVYVMNRDGSGRHLLARVEAPERTEDGAFRTRDVAWSPDGRRIACVSDGTLWVMKADGSGQRALVPGSGPAWSPDGRKIAFSAESGISVVNADGSGGLRDLTDHELDGNPVWSPDGRAIAFTSNRDGNTEIYVMDADGSDERNVSQSPMDDFSPAWSPKN